MRLVAALVRGLRIAAVAALVAMAAITLVDVTMRNTINELVLGGVELVQLALVITIFLALPETSLRDEHITIDLVDHFAPAAVVVWLKRVAALATVAFLGVIAWRMAVAAADTLGLGDRTSDLGIPLIWYWLPLLIGTAAAVLASALVAHQTLRSRNGPS